MIRLADWLTKWIWFSVLWLMRRDSIRSLHGRHFQGSRRQAFVKQNFFALKYGRRILRVIILLFLAYLFLGFTYLLSQKMLDSGLFNPPR